MTAFPPWFEEARHLMGVAEIAGAKSNSVILGWARKLGGWIAKGFTNDDTAWCGLFVAHCISATLAETLPGNPLGALQWARFGRAGVATPGAILVFKRPGKPGAGHVGFYVAETVDAYLVRGGNQGNKVCETWIAKARCVAIRWPASFPLPLSGPVLVASKSAKLSTNEA